MYDIHEKYLFRESLYNSRIQGKLYMPQEPIESVMVRFYEKVLDRIDLDMWDRNAYLCGYISSTRVSEAEYKRLEAMRERYNKRYGKALKDAIKAEKKRCA